MLLSLEGDKIECMVRLDFPTTNNEVEYEARVVGLDLAKAAGVTSAVILSLPLFYNYPHPFFMQN